MSASKKDGLNTSPSKPALASVVETGKAHASNKRSDAALLSPFALMALGLTGAATEVFANDTQNIVPAPMTDAEPVAADLTAPDAATPAQSDTDQVAGLEQQIAELTQSMSAEMSSADAAIAVVGGSEQTTTADSPIAYDSSSAAQPVQLALADIPASPVIVLAQAQTSYTSPASRSAAADTSNWYDLDSYGGVLAGLAVVGVAASKKSSDTTPPVNVSGLETGATWKYSTDAGTTWIAGTGTSFTLTGDGVKSVTVRQTDTAGNVGANATTLAFTIDTTVAAPTVALTTDTGTSATDKITSNGALTVSGADGSATVEYSSNGTSGWSATAPTATVGSNTVYAHQTDAAGNVSAASTALTFTLDTAAPVAQSMAASSTATTIALTYDGNIDTANLPAVGAFTVTTGGVANKVASISATGSVLTLTLTNAFTSGSAVTLAYTDPTTGNDTAAVQDAAGNDAASFKQGVVADGYIRGAQIYIDTNANGVADASELLAGVVTDANGNFFLPSTAPTGTIIAVGGVNIDTGVASTVALKAPAGSTTINPLTTLVQAVIDAAPTGTVITSAQASATVATALGLTLPTGQTLTSYDPLSASDVNALATQKAAAQVATTLTLAASAPTDTTTATQAIAAVVGNMVTAVNAAVTAATTLNLASSATIDTLFTNSTGGSIASTAAIADAKSGVAAISTATTLSAVTLAQSDVLDNTAPATPGIDLLAGSDSGGSSTDNLTNDTTPTLRVTLEAAKSDGSAVVAGDTVSIKNGSTTAGTHVVTSAEITQGYADVTPSAVADGVYTLTAIVTDKAGNISAASSSLVVTVDSAAAAPTLALTSDTGTSATDKITSNGAYTASGAETGATVEYSSNGTSGWSATAPTAAAGSNTVYVRQTDAAGNVSAASTALTFTLDTTAPTLSNAVATTAADGTVSFDFTFSEAVTGFDATDVTLGNATAGAFTATAGGLKYSLIATPTAAATPQSLTVSVAAGAGADAAGNASTAGGNYSQSVLVGTSSANTLTLGTASDYIFLGGGSDTIKFASAAGSTTAATDKVLDTFGAGDKIDLSALLGSSGNGYTSSALGDTGSGFVELKNLTLTSSAATAKTVVTFDVAFDLASISSSAITAATIDLDYQYSLAVDGVATSPKFGSRDVWQLIQPNLSPADGGTSSQINGMIALVANTNSANPIITTTNTATGAVLSVELTLTGVLQTFSVGLQSVAAGGSTSITTADGTKHNVDVGITKTAGATVGATGTLEIITDTTTLGTVTDNQLHMVSTYETATDTTHLKVQYDTNASFGTTALSSVIALDFAGDVTANLTTTSLTYI
ncbi:MAG: Ig-like domain-containing protein [Burkholderiales bacterium]|nr:Ig-like domain-containing protein [Burkholderiales bacterium]